MAKQLGSGVTGADAVGPLVMGWPSLIRAATKAACVVDLAAVARITGSTLVRPVGGGPKRGERRQTVAEGTGAAAVVIGRCRHARRDVHDPAALRPVDATDVNEVRHVVNRAKCHRGCHAA